MKEYKNTHTMMQAAMFLALAYVMPFFTGQIQQIGNMLCPMHIPVLLCGFLCGGKWGLLVGFLAPLMRSVTLGMPILFPNAICMALELAVYGSVSGAVYQRCPKRKIYVYISLMTAMIAGRLVWGVAMFFCMGVTKEFFGLEAFWFGAVTGALPGIVLQIILVPVLVFIFQRTEVREDFRITKAAGLDINDEIK